MLRELADDLVDVDGIPPLALELEHAVEVLQPDRPWCPCHPGQSHDDAWGVRLHAAVGELVVVAESVHPHLLAHLAEEQALLPLPRIKEPQIREHADVLHRPNQPHEDDKEAEHKSSQAVEESRADPLAYVLSDAADNQWIRHLDEAEKKHERQTRKKRR